MVAPQGSSLSRALRGYCELKQLGGLALRLLKTRMTGSKESL